MKLIGSGLLLGVLPLLLHGPVGAGLRPLAPFGWLLVVFGIGLFWWKPRTAPAADATAEPSDRRKPKRPPVRLQDPPKTPYRVTTGADVLKEAGRALREPAAVAETSATRERPSAWSAEVFDVIEWRRFEALVEALFAQAGFETRSQTHGADGGVDIWLHSKSLGGAPASIVQCKHWTGKPVGVDKIRELRGVMASHGIARGQFATTSTFTADATSFAKANGVNLLDVDRLLALIASRTPAQQQDLLAVALEGEYWRPTCASCGVKLVERTPRNGGAMFWGCRNYPRCKTRMTMRQWGEVAR